MARICTSLQQRKRCRAHNTKAQTDRSRCSRCGHAFGRRRAARLRRTCTRAASSAGRWRKRVGRNCFGSTWVHSRALHVIATGRRTGREGRAGRAVGGNLNAGHAGGDRDDCRFRGDNSWLRDDDRRLGSSWLRLTGHDTQGVGLGQVRRGRVVLLQMIVSR